MLGNLDPSSTAILALARGYLCKRLSLQREWSIRRRYGERYTGESPQKDPAWVESIGGGQTSYGCHLG